LGRGTVSDQEWKFISQEETLYGQFVARNMCFSSLDHLTNDVTGELPYVKLLKM